MTNAASSYDCIYSLKPRQDDRVSRVSKSVKGGVTG
jgi:hypothetical protein